MALFGDDCYFFYYSSCAKGPACPFRHSPAALGKEEVCGDWSRGCCRTSNCPRRHMVIQKDRGTIECYWESQPMGCTKPHCPFKHVNPRPSSLPQAAVRPNAAGAAAAVIPQQVRNAGPAAPQAQLSRANQPPPANVRHQPPTTAAAAGAPQVPVNRAVQPVKPQPSQAPRPGPAAGNPFLQGVVAATVASAVLTGPRHGAALPAQARRQPARPQQPVTIVLPDDSDTAPVHPVQVLRVTLPVVERNGAAAPQPGRGGRSPQDSFARRQLQSQGLSSSSGPSRVSDCAADASSRRVSATGGGVAARNQRDSRVTNQRDSRVTVTRTVSAQGGQDVRAVQPAKRSSEGDNPRVPSPKRSRRGVQLTESHAPVKVQSLDEILLAKNGGRKPVKEPQRSPQKPVASQQRSVASQQGPSASQQRSVASQQGPSASQQRPVASQQRPATSQQRPAASQQRPATSQQKPAASQQRPAASQQRPAASQQGPVASQDLTLKSLRAKRFAKAASPAAALIPATQQKPLERSAPKSDGSSSTLNAKKAVSVPASSTSGGSLRVKSLQEIRAEKRRHSEANAAINSTTDEKTAHVPSQSGVRGGIGSRSSPRQAAEGNTPPVNATHAKSKSAAMPPPSCSVDPIPVAVSTPATKRARVASVSRCSPAATNAPTVTAPEDEATPGEPNLTTTSLDNIDLLDDDAFAKAMKDIVGDMSCDLSDDIDVGLSDEMNDDDLLLEAEMLMQ